LAVEETKKTQGCIGEKKEEGVVIHPTVSQTQCGEHATRRDAEAAAEVFVGHQGRRTDEMRPPQVTARAADLSIASLSRSYHI